MDHGRWPASAQEHRLETGEPNKPIQLKRAARSSSCALGFTQYEPKPAGRRADAHACSVSQQGSTVRISQDAGFTIGPSLDMTSSMWLASSCGRPCSRVVL